MRYDIDKPGPPPEIISASPGNLKKNIFNRKKKINKLEIWFLRGYFKLFFGFEKECFFANKKKNTRKKRFGIRI